jgi:hypothetical protein
MTTQLDKLEKYIDQRFTDNEKMEAAFLKAIEARIDAVIADAATRFPTRDEFTKIIERMENDIRAIQINSAKIDGKADQSYVGSLRFFSIASLILSFLSLVVIGIHLFL